MYRLGVKPKIGDSVGMILKFLEPKKYELREAKITSIRITRQGSKVYAPKRFHPIFEEDIVSSTSWMKQNKDLILVREPILLDDELRDRMVRWCKWATEHYQDLDRCAEWRRIARDPLGSDRRISSPKSDHWMPLPKAPGVE